MIDRPAMALAPSPEDRDALTAALAAYRQAMTIRDRTRGANLVALHEEACEDIRARRGLPARDAGTDTRQEKRARPDQNVTSGAGASALWSCSGGQAAGKLAGCPDGRPVAPRKPGGCLCPDNGLGTAGPWRDQAGAASNTSLARHDARLAGDQTGIPASVEPAV